MAFVSVSAGSLGVVPRLSGKPETKIQTYLSQEEPWTWYFSEDRDRVVFRHDMGSPDSNQKNTRGLLHGFSPAEPPWIFWNSRKRTEVDKLNLNLNGNHLLVPANSRPVEKPKDEIVITTETTEDVPMVNSDKSHDAGPPLSNRRKALFEPLEPINDFNKERISNEMLLPPPDFDSTAYPKGWLIGKKRKLVNVDVVESMRRIASQEMTRKEIDGLNEQIEEDSRCLEHLQVQLLEERSKRAQVERENAMLQNQISMLMNMLQESEEVNEEILIVNS